MNKKGFISISVVYSFFIVFILLLVFIVNSLVEDRQLLSKIKEKVKEDIASNNFAGYVIKNARADQLKHFGEFDTPVSGSTPESKFFDGSYRFVGSNPNNYVCLDDNENGSCNNSSDLYRIIGIFNNRVKLISNNSFGSMNFNSKTNDTAADADNRFVKTATIYKYLNNESPDYDLAGNIIHTFVTSYFPKSGYYSYRRVIFDNLIEETDWKRGGIDNINSVGVITDNNLSVIINGESSEIVKDTKIGLLSISEYILASSSVNSVSNFSSYKNNNWLARDTSYWLINYSKVTTNHIYYISSSSNNIISSKGARNDDYYGSADNVIPVFYLKPSVKYLSGDGSSSTPYRVKGIGGA